MWWCDRLCQLKRMRTPHPRQSWRAMRWFISQRLAPTERAAVEESPIWHGDEKPARHAVHIDPHHSAVGRCEIEPCHHGQDGRHDDDEVQHHLSQVHSVGQPTLTSPAIHNLETTVFQQPVTTRSNNSTCSQPTYVHLMTILQPANNNPLQSKLRSGMIPTNLHKYKSLETTL